MVSVGEGFEVWIIGNFLFPGSDDCANEEDEEDSRDIVSLAHSNGVCYVAHVVFVYFEFQGEVCVEAAEYFYQRRWCPIFSRISNSMA